MKGKKHKAGGGGLPMKVSGNPDVFKEAEAKKKGGHVKKRKDGGAVEKTVGLMTGGAVKPRMDRPGRKSGGRVGANTSPLSTAHNTTSAGKSGGKPD
jgi:hypothetical protein